MATAQKPPCSFPGCPNRVAWGDLCAAHQQQRARGQQLRAVRVRGKPGVRLPSITISVECATALAGRGPTPYLAAREVLEWWAIAYAAGQLTGGKPPGTDATSAPAAKPKQPKGHRKG